MIVTSKTFKHEMKCMNCGKGSFVHRSTDKACPLASQGKSSFVSFNETGMHFVDSGSPTTRSKNQLKKLEQQEKGTREFEDAQNAELKKVRAMTLDEVVHETKAIIRRWTGLGVFLEQNRDDSFDIHLLANGVMLGFMTVTKTTSGSYIVGGSYSGAFMAGGDKSLMNVLRPGLEELEERANKEKGK